MGITDGTSNTVMLGHGNINVTQYKSDKDVTLSSNIFNGGTTGTILPAATPPPPTSRTIPVASACRRTPDKLPGVGSGGPFPQGSLFVLCDGSARTISYSFQNLSCFLTPDGGEAVQID